MTTNTKFCFFFLKISTFGVEGSHLDWTPINRIPKTVLRPSLDDPWHQRENIDGMAVLLMTPSVSDLPERHDDAESPIPKQGDQGNMFRLSSALEESLHALLRILR